jgi:hypothetical protein
VITVRVRRLAELTDGLTDLQRTQLPFAMALALTRTARLVKRETYRAFGEKFDKPTPFVMSGSFPGEENRDSHGSLWVKQADKRQPIRQQFARVWLKDEPYAKQRVAMDPLLKHHFSGGARVAKGLELWFRELGLLEAGEFLIPNKGARLNKYGNLSQGQYQQILSQFAMKRSSGYNNEASDSRRSQKNQAAAGKIFWSAGPGGAKPLTDLATGITYGHTGMGAGRKNNLPKGVWVRQGKDLACILLVHRRAPNYPRSINLQQIGDRVVREHFAAEFKAALRDAMRTAGKLKGNASRDERVSDWRARAYR